MRIQDLRCTKCGAIQTDVAVGDTFPNCPLCAGPTTWIPARVNTDIFGGPKYITSLDQTFDSKASLRSYLRDNGLQEAGDRVGGARNESHLGLGKVFSGGRIPRATRNNTRRNAS